MFRSISWCIFAHAINSMLRGAACQRPQRLHARAAGRAKDRQPGERHARIGANLATRSRSFDRRQDALRGVDVRNAPAPRSRCETIGKKRIKNAAESGRPGDRAVRGEWRAAERSRISVHTPARRKCQVRRARTPNVASLSWRARCHVSHEARRARAHHIGRPLRQGQRHTRVLALATADTRVRAT